MKYLNLNIEQLQDTVRRIYPGKNVVKIKEEEIAGQYEQTEERMIKLSLSIEFAETDWDLTLIVPETADGSFVCGMVYQYLLQDAVAQLDDEWADGIN